ncbi:uncharacterized protein N0V89_012348 [Didymosphaeria variabile]|uniref:Carrier domain-containing protein n=1 Tax=Didymosphaeria variabile TaxID=1932322 RepID=A0A9W8XAW8_9PLEO|nr:uncharacterized protein N0V89_012348 [Didymosphaeria variabile]KAJ4344604.1 hypothetical protein N0V89_012348 [Didymosphaeria variabile]
MEANYFVCTLGQASALNPESKPYRTISQFLAHQSRSCGSKPAVGFPLPQAQDEWAYELLTFDDVFTGTQVFAKRLSKSFDSSSRNPQTVALMAHSSPEFLFTWLGLMYLGHSVLLLAPQCQPGAIVHLCKACSVSILFYDAAHSQRAVDADQLQQNCDGPKFSIVETPLGGHEDIFQIIRAPQPDFAPVSNVDEFSVAYLHHTSAASSTSDPTQPAVKYFSSVPYVLQMMEADTKGLEILKSMDIVGVGGAALPVEVGDRLVRNEVNLISRFGSAECGFLLSSYRNFAKDKEWQYLRNYNPAELVEFERQDDGLAELVVKPGWPHMAKTNREDGSFATADLFESHPKIGNAWFYHSRADSQLTLITGKKFDPAPVEAAIATAEELDDVLIFGDNRPFPGALLLRSQNASGLSDEEVLSAIWPQIDKLNKESQDHARIPRHMLIPVEHQDKPLEKSSKGTIIRKAAEARFSRLIEGAYETKDDQEFQDVDDKDLPQYLSQLVQSMIQSSVLPEEDTDLFSYGVDSIACMRLRSKLHQLTPNYNQELPLSVVEDCSTIRNLSNYIIRKRHGEADANTEDEEQMMLDLVERYGDFSSYKPASQEPKSGEQRKLDSGEVIVLTGATGALGAHILDLLRSSRTVSAIYCLVRGADESAAKERVSKALSQRGLTDLSSASKSNEKVKIVQAALGEPRLGLPDDVYNDLAAEATSILHIAWTVNFRLKLRSFAKDNLAGVRHLLDLALAAGRADPPRFAYCSSTASIINSAPDAEGCLPEHLSDDPAAASPLGYSRSKWVAEHICLAAHRGTSLNGRISVIRVGQLSGDSRTGIWNTKEAWPMMLSTARLISCLPQLGDAPLDWLPVDIAAEAFLQAASAPSTSGHDVQVYHVLNPHREPTWATMLRWLKKKQNFKVVSPEEWVRRLGRCKSDGYSAMKLLGLWQEAYGEGKDKAEVEEGKDAKFSIRGTQKSIEAIRGVRPLDEEYVGRIWEWVQANVH